MTQFFVNVLMQDAYGKGRRTRRRYELDVVDYAGAVARAGTLVTALAAITECNILNYTISNIVPFADAVTAGANIDAGVTLSWDLGAGKQAASQVPSPEAAILDGYGNVDLTNAAVLAFESEYTSGEVLISDGETALDLLAGKLDK